MITVVSVLLDAIHALACCAVAGISLAVVANWCVKRFRELYDRAL